MSCSETHNIANLRMTRRQSFAALSEVMALARQAQVPVNVSLSCVFGCPMEGDVPADEVLRLGDWFLERGATGVTLCDTTGMANPAQVERLCAGLIERWKGTELTLHFHDTRGMGLANVLAGLNAGIDRYDASLGGLGGCPFAPGATGNVVFEDLAFLCESKGFKTGIDIEKLVAVREILKSEMPDEVLYGGLARAGLPRGTAAKAA
jgi:hydroxymethylglutaryl-CoA lyase